MTKKMIELDDSDFKNWMRHPITKELFKIFEENKTEIESGLLALSAPSTENAREKSVYLRGGYDVYSVLAQLTFDSMFLKEEEKSHEVEKTPYSW